MFMVRELVLLDADYPVDLGELSFVPIQRRDVDSRNLDREIFVGSLRLSFLMLWCVVLFGGLLFPVRVEVCSFFEERGLRVGRRPRVVCRDCC